MPEISNEQERRHQILDQAKAVLEQKPLGFPYVLLQDEPLWDSLHKNVPVLAVLRHCAKTSHEEDIDEYQKANPDAPIDLLIESSEQTKLFDEAYQAAIRAYVFGRRV